MNGNTISVASEERKLNAKLQSETGRSLRRLFSV